MHYKNGREAKAGDRVVSLEHGISGIIYDTLPGADTCNARLATVSWNDPTITISECVHIDDVKGSNLEDVSSLTG